MMPLVVMLAPAGGFTKPYPVMVEWIFDSVAALVTVSNVNSLTLVCAAAGSAGATFTSSTTTLKLLVMLNGGVPLSVTTTATVSVPGLWVCAGVQVKMPLLAPIFIPGNGDKRLNDSAWDGTSRSLAWLVTESWVNSLTT